MSQAIKEALDRAGLAPKEFAKITGRGEATIYRWIKSGVVRAVRIGPRLLIIPMGEIERILSQGTEETV